jgi:hypothetical protein
MYKHISESVALGQAFFRVFQFSRISVTALMLHNLHLHTVITGNKGSLNVLVDLGEVAVLKKKLLAHRLSSREHGHSRSPPNLPPEDGSTCRFRNVFCFEFETLTKCTKRVVAY